MTSMLAMMGAMPCPEKNELLKTRIVNEAIIAINTGNSIFELSCDYHPNGILHDIIFELNIYEGNCPWKSYSCISWNELTNTVELFTKIGYTGEQINEKF